jgi:glucose/arabinose dehydrogenase
MLSRNASAMSGRLTALSRDTLADRLELVADQLSSPTGLTFDDRGTAFVSEAGLGFGGAKPGGRIWQIAPDGRRVLVADDLRPPVNGVTFHAGHLYVSEGTHGGCITRLDPSGARAVLVDNLPGPGNYHANMIVVGADARLYFSQGAMTNTGVVGPDALGVAWLRRLPHAADVPGYDIELAGANVETADTVSRGDAGRTTRTGAFVPFGTETTAAQRLAGQLPCTAAVMRCNLDGSNLELVAWGLRNAYGLGFLPDGRLIATDQGADDRGSRPVGNAPDLLHVVERGAWYGWPDFIGNLPVTDARFKPERGTPPTFVLRNHAELPPPRPALLEFPPHSGALKFAVVPDGAPRFSGQIIVALFGDEYPLVAPAGAHAGRAIARIDPGDWSLHPLLDAPLHRPIDVRFHPLDRALYILDFGLFEIGNNGSTTANERGGRLWRLPLDQF